VKRIFIPTRGADDWRALLADPKTHWRDGYSAKLLAERWEAAGEFPPEIRSLFESPQFSSPSDAELLLALPEHQVALPGGGRPSQNDLLVIARLGGQLAVIAVEGKASESFGPTLEEWAAGESAGKAVRLAFLQETLGLPTPLPPQLRYQFLHRTVSAVIEAQRFCASQAAMIVHSFSPTDEGLADYQVFLGCFGVRGRPGELVPVGCCAGVSLYCGWARGRVGS